MIFSDCYAGLDRKAVTQATGCSGSVLTVCYLLSRLPAPHIYVAVREAKIGHF